MLRRPGAQSYRFDVGFVNPFSKNIVRRSRSISWVAALCVVKSANSGRVEFLKVLCLGTP